MSKAYLNWSSGKDAALALYKIQENKEFSIDKLITTINSEVDRVSMHGLRQELLIEQAESIGIPLQLIELHGNVSMETYNTVINEAVSQLKSENFTHSVFGDILLEDLKKYREDQLEKIGIEAVFPLWKKDTKDLIMEIIDLGFKAVTVCVNAKVLGKEFCGRVVDMDFVNSLPPNVDPCGENGEFHTFVYDGPNFKNPINLEIGDIVERHYSASKDGDDCFKEEPESWDTAFWFCDLLPKHKI